MRTYKQPTIEERKAKYVLVDPENGCWFWTGSLQKSGYGRIGINKTTKVAHKFFYEHLVGVVPAGLVLDHLCHTNSDCEGGPTCPHRRCVNPEHLEPVTPKENIARGNTAKRHSEKTHCPHGHEYSAANTRINNGCRQCRTCDRVRARLKRGTPEELWRGAYITSDYSYGKTLAG